MICIIGRVVLFSAILLGIQACDSVLEHESTTNDILFDTNSSLQLSAPKILVESRAIDTELLAVQVEVSYQVADTDYRYVAEAAYSGPAGNGRWALNIDVPVNTTFTLSMTWFEPDSTLELVRITREFEGFGQDGRTELAYQFTPNAEFSNEPDALDYAGFDADDDRQTNIRERIAGTDPFDSDDPAAFQDTNILVANPNSVNLRPDLSGSTSIAIELDNLGNSPVNFTVSTDGEWLEIEPSSGAVAAGSSTVINASANCSESEAIITGSINVLSDGLPSTIPVRLDCTQTASPIMNNVTQALNSQVLINNQASEEIELTNSGNAPLLYELTTDSDWIQPQQTNGEIAPGQTTRLNVLLDCGVSVGERSGQLSVTSNGGDASINVVLDCIEQPEARLLLDRSSLQLTAQTNVSGNGTLVISNTGNITLTASINSDRSWLSTLPDSISVDSGQSASVAVSGQCASEAESRTAALEIVSNGNNGQNTSVPVTLVCTVAPQAILGNVSPSVSESIIADQSVESAISLSNLGNALLSYSLQSDNNWVEIIQNEGNLAIGDSVRVGISLQCDGREEIFNGLVRISSNGGQVAVPVTLNCTRIPSPILSDVNGPLTFDQGDFASAEAALTFSNSGEALLSYSLSSDAPWISLSNTEGSLEASEQTSINIVGSCANETGDREGVISIISDGGDANIELFLICRRAELSDLDPLEFEFTASVLQTDQSGLSFANTGNDTLLFTISSDSPWLCPDDPGTANCQTGDESFSAELLPNETYSLPIAAKCPAETGFYSGGFTLSGNFDSVNIPATLTCLPAALEAAQISISYPQPKTFRFEWEDRDGAEYYQLLERAAPSSVFVTVNQSIETGVQRYDHAVALHLKHNASYRLLTCNELECVQSDIVSVEGNLVDSIGYIEGNSGFGEAIDISGDGSTMAVYHNDSGAVSIYRSSLLPETRTQWYLETTLAIDDSLGTNDYSPYSISLNEDGSRLAVGLPEAPYNPCECNPGAVLIYARNQSMVTDPFASGVPLFFWSIENQLIGPEPSSGDEFGRSVAMDSTGSRVLVGSPGSNEVYEYNSEFQGEESGTPFWYQTNTIQPADDGIQRSTTTFGRYIQLSRKSETLIVSGDVVDRIGGAESQVVETSRAVYVFRGDSWNQEAILLASNNETESNSCDGLCGDYFGIALSVSGDGERIAIGAGAEDSAAAGVNGDQSDNSLSESGAAYVYSRNGGSWDQEAYIKASSPNSIDYFGYSLDLDYTGNLLAIGAWEEASGDLGFGADETADIFAGVGAGYLFSRSGGSWQQSVYFKASKATINLGEAIRISDDGQMLVISSSYSNELYYY